MNGLYAAYTHPCKLDCALTPGVDDGSATYLAIVAKVWPACFLWGFGTAIGELPPYLVSKAARLAGQRSGDFEAEIEAARASTDVFSRLKLWTMDFTEKHGFVGVLLLAGWPNAAFDMCGMCCGYLLMPFATFFVAVVLGKAVLKVGARARQGGACGSEAVPAAQRTRRPTPLNPHAARRPPHASPSPPPPAARAPAPATARAPRRPQVTGQALFFVALFGKAFFAASLNAVARPLERVLLNTTGVQLALVEFGIQKRLVLVENFKKQTRFTPAALVAKFGNKRGLDIGGLKRLFADFAADGAGRVKIARRVLRLWDANGDKFISAAELAPLVSSTDGQFSLGALDQVVGVSPSLVKQVRTHARVGACRVGVRDWGAID